MGSMNAYRMCLGMVAGIEKGRGDFLLEPGRI